MQSIGALLSEFLASQEGVKFSWRGNNCGHFVGQWLLLAERVDYVAGLDFAMPRNTAGAYRLALKHGGMHTLVSNAIRRPVIQAPLAQVGDVVLFKPVGEAAGVLAICNGRVAMARSETGGVVAVEMSLAQYAWRLDRFVE